MLQQEELTLFNFQKLFNNEDACQEHLFNMRWKDGFCFYAVAIKNITLFLSSAFCQDCSYLASLTAGTVFHKNYTPLQK